VVWRTNSKTGAIFSALIYMDIVADGLVGKATISEFIQRKRRQTPPFGFFDRFFRLTATDLS
jgi:hypothetical protein